MIDASPAIWLPSKPAIIRPHETVELRLHVNNADAGHSLPRDFLALPPVLRQAVSAVELRKLLPEPYRLLPDSMLLSMLGGLPGPLMAGGIKVGWLYVTDDTFTVPSDWNKDDNIIHALGAGGNGRPTTQNGIFPNEYYGGPGGGGSAWAALVNLVAAIGDQFAADVGTAATQDTSFGSSALLLAQGGANGGNISGGSGTGGQGGQASTSVGTLKSNGGDGGSLSGSGTTCAGRAGGGAGGPHGDGGDGGTTGGGGDAGFGGVPDPQADGDGGDGIDGPAGGFNPGAPVNAGSGAGGAWGVQGTSDSINGKNGGRYGAGGGGAGADFVPFFTRGAAGSFSQGCVLVVNNPSL